MADAIDNQNAGVYHYLKNLIEALIKIDNKNSYTFIHCRKNSFFDDKNDLIVPSKGRLGRETFRRCIKIPNVIKKINPDIVFEPCHIGLFNLPKKIKKVVMIHDLTPIIFPKFHILKSVLIHKLFLKKVFKIADLILTPSENTKKDIAKLYSPKAKIIVTPLGIKQSETGEQGFERMIHEPYILYLGTVEPRKNLSVLIDAFNELKKEKNIPHKLVLAGDIGWKSKTIMKKIKNKEIILTGYLSGKDKERWYKGAEIFVYPSIYEGFGLPPLEAMSYGIPVICSTGGSLKELFQNHALTFEPSDKELLKKHILAVLNDLNLREKLVSNGEKYSEQFTWEKTARKTLEAFDELILE